MGKLGYTKNTIRLDENLDEMPVTIAEKTKFQI